MSLINDALKRASQSERNRARETEQPPAMMPARPQQRSILPVVIGVAVVVLLAAAGWFLYLSLRARNLPTPAPPLVVSKPAVPEPPPKVEPAPVPAPPPPPVVVAVPVVVSNPPVAPAAPVAVAPPPFPDLKLQGIFYSRKNPRIIINDETRGEGEMIDGVQIVKILPTKITVQWNGQTKDLLLESH
jgi:hypothetical protein